MSNEFPVTKKQIKVFVSIFIVLIVLLFGKRFVISVEAGHVAVATLFGEVQTEVYSEGLHIPVNPLYKWHIYDARQNALLDPLREHSEFRVIMKQLEEKISRMRKNVLENGYLE